MFSEKAEDAHLPLCWEVSSLFWIMGHFLQLLLLSLFTITPTLSLQWLSVHHHHGAEFPVQNSLALPGRDFSQYSFEDFFSPLEIYFSSSYSS